MLPSGGSTPSACARLRRLICATAACGRGPRACLSLRLLARLVCLGRASTTFWRRRNLLDHPLERLARRDRNAVPCGCGLLRLVGLAFVSHIAGLHRPQASEAEAPSARNLYASAKLCAPVYWPFSAAFFTATARALSASLLASVNVPRPRAAHAAQGPTYGIGGAKLERADDGFGCGNPLIQRLTICDGAHTPAVSIKPKTPAIEPVANA